MDRNLVLCNVYIDAYIHRSKLQCYDILFRLEKMIFEWLWLLVIFSEQEIPMGSIDGRWGLPLCYNWRQGRTTHLSHATLASSSRPSIYLSFASSTIYPLAYSPRMHLINCVVQLFHLKGSILVCREAQTGNLVFEIDPFAKQGSYKKSEYVNSTKTKREEGVEG